MEDNNALHSYLMKSARRYCILPHPVFVNEQQEHYNCRALTIYICTDNNWTLLNAP